jgi:hypothetical protein
VPDAAYPGHSKRREQEYLEARSTLWVWHLRESTTLAPVSDTPVDLFYFFYDFYLKISALRHYRLNVAVGLALKTERKKSPTKPTSAPSNAIALATCALAGFPVRSGQNATD